jgi:hypothetical protein
VHDGGAQLGIEELGAEEDAELGEEGEGRVHACVVADARARVGTTASRLTPDWEG